MPGYLRVHARIRVHARKCFYSRDSEANLRSTVYLASICEFHRSANDLRGGIHSKALFRDSLPRRNRNLSNNSHCNNLASNVPSGNNYVANNDKINLEEREARRETRMLEKYIPKGYKRVFGISMDFDDIHLRFESKRVLQ